MIKNKLKVLSIITTVCCCSLFGGTIIANAESVNKVGNEPATQVQITLSNHSEFHSVSKQEAAKLNELAKTHNVKSFKNVQEAEKYVKQENNNIIKNTENATNQSSELYYGGVAQTTENFNTCYAVLSVPYGVSWSSSLGNYYSNVGQASVSLAGFTAWNSLSNGYGSAWAVNNDHSISAQGGGTLNDYLLISGLWKVGSTPFTISGYWNVG